MPYFTIHSHTHYLIQQTHAKRSVLLKALREIILTVGTMGATIFLSNKQKYEKKQQNNGEVK